MIDNKRLETIQASFQTTPEAVIREYSQHLFLSLFYREREAFKVLFKGGTALRFAYKSPRFSEDLDFSAFGTDARGLEEIILAVLLELSRQNVKIEIKDSKTTTGGYLANLVAFIEDRQASIAIQVSFRGKSKLAPEIVNITNEYIPTYVANLVPQSVLVGEKVHAALTRGKPRDFFDVYYLLREGLIKGEDIEKLRKVREILKQKDIDFKKELELFLPASMKHFVASFPGPLLRELERFV